MNSTTTVGQRKLLVFHKIMPAVENIRRRFTESDTVKASKKTGRITPLPNYKVVHEMTKKEVAEMVGLILGYRQPYAKTPLIYIDLEGDNLGRNGELELAQIYLASASTVYLVYINFLGNSAFDTPAMSHQPMTLKDILESSTIIKAFWDCRSDSDALYFHFSIRLDAAAVVDLQLLACATEKDAGSRKTAKSLESAVHSRLNLPRLQEEQWLESKSEGEGYIQNGKSWREEMERDVHKSEAVYGTCWPRSEEQQAAASKKWSSLEAGDDEESVERLSIWKEHPLRPEMVQYAVGDVTVMPLLYHHLISHARLTPERKKAVAAETAKRIEASQADVLAQAGKDGPAGWSEKGWVEKATKTSIAILPPMKLAGCDGSSGTCQAHECSTQNYGG